MTAPTEQKGLFERLQAAKDEHGDFIFWAGGAGEKLCDELGQRLAEAERRMAGIKNILEAITPNIAQEAVILIVNAALELTAPQQEPNHE
jgi:hypothetical protein